ncbi:MULTISPECIES: methyltransferase domain-containing protein [unclassified Cyanobium]|uniref:class I SAM-dependent methyltransferase n=1 Tax=unclassified Cyanobium TaxID=2627006 RepID=UPI0020CDA23A|nr:MULTISPECIES: methyltransferase domain-containing protein [unclassified Cyanobium]MCP9860388.1 methyltransferase domain-containing protein [Cyanobium sp. Cruz-8H5]MCP9867698.1 methyltransferase domain-containing protein [Cyanobium sp. Cruz-8D1]
MKTTKHAITSIITSNYIPQALTLYSYIQESNPETSFLVLVLGERDSLPQALPLGPEWIYWDELLNQETRMRLAKEYTPFELSCVVRGRLHHYLSTKRSFEKWIMVDTDIGILASLDPIWEELDSGCIALTPHASKPVNLDHAFPHERNILKHGLFNAGVVGMRHSEAAEEASQWLCERLEAFGHSYAHRQASGLPTHHDFEFVDQIWLNLLPVYFRDSTVVLAREVYNLGHWNLHQGELTRHDGVAYFNKQKVVIAHFSGLPNRQNLEMVSAHSQLYLDRPSQAWAAMAEDYLDRLEIAKRVVPSVPYAYTAIQPRKSTDERASPAVSGPPKHIIKRALRKLCLGLKSPDKIIGGMKLVGWQIKRSSQILPSVLSNRSAEKIFIDRSPNAFTDLIPCMGNYETLAIRTWILQAVSQAKQQFHGKLLDVGAGSSPYEELIMETGRISQYIKLDFAKSEYHKGHSLDLTWDGKTIPLQPQSIDTVLMTEVLEHVHRPGDLLREVRRVLKPGGVLFLTVPFIWPMHELPYDYHRFTPVALKAYLEEADFNVQNIQILGGWDHSLAQMLGLWLTNRSMGERKRKIAKLLAWPFYSFLLRRGQSEYKEVRNHQMHIGLAAVALATDEHPQF